MTATGTRYEVGHARDRHKTRGGASERASQKQKTRERRERRGKRTWETLGTRERLRLMERRTEGGRASEGRSEVRASAGNSEPRRPRKHKKEPLGLHKRRGRKGSRGWSCMRGNQEGGREGRHALQE
eukprot:scaffold126916_cov34-Tisochrysis_lutea.AAC.2